MSKIEIRFRVVTVSPFNQNEIILFTSINYTEALKFCNEYTGNDTLEIKKVWIPIYE